MERLELPDCLWLLLSWEEQEALGSPQVRSVVLTTERQFGITLAYGREM